MNKKRKMKKVKLEELREVISDLANINGDSDMVCGAYQFKNYRIQISKYGQDGKGRAALLYKKRRSTGRCVACGAKVKRKNPQTGRLYRLCDKHRAQIDHKKKVA